MSAPHILHIFSTFAPAGPELRAVGLIHATGEAYRHSILAIDGRTDAKEMLPEREDVRVLEAPPKAGTWKTSRRLRTATPTWRRASKSRSGRSRSGRPSLVPS